MATPSLKEQLEDLVLAALEDEKNGLDADEFLKSKDLTQHRNVLLSVLQSLSGWQFVEVKENSTKVWRLKPEGEEYLEKGSPEAQLFKAVGADGILQADLAKQFGKLFKIGFGACKKNKWVDIDKATKKVVRKVDSITDTAQEQLATIKKTGMLEDNKALKLLKKRKLIQTETLTTYHISKGPKYQRQRKRLATDITADMLKDGTWKSEEFKPYNFKAKGAPPEMGCLHPLMKVRAEFRAILLQMGFEEMPTNNFVESSFWNFDTLFQPQQHPARDAHDTFFLKAPVSCNRIPDREYCERVRQTHENGWQTGSIGHRYQWSLDEAKKNILRTHTTAVSSRMLYKWAQELKTQPFKPKKYFSIDRVFRNESVDSTHLAEFHQVEGFIADRNLTLGDLIGTIQEFFKRIDIHNVHFKPTYNPYTEPSMEIFTHSKELDVDIEIGNSGVFRPEMLKPMGLPDDVRVIAWGLSLERPTMVKYGLGNIRDLFGHTMKLKLIRENPICRYGVEDARKQSNQIDEEKKQ